jgi:hypothetical protein
MDTDTLTVTTAMWAWEEQSAAVAVVPWPDTRGRTDRFTYTSGACYAFVHDLTPAQLTEYVLAEAIKLMTDYGCDPVAVHRAFSAIREYRRATDYFPVPTRTFAPSTRVNGADVHREARASLPDGRPGGDRAA